MRGVAAGVLDADSVLDGAIAVYPQFRSNVVYRIEDRGEPVAYIKQRGAASLVDGDDVVANERRALTLLSGARFAPRVLAASHAEAVWSEAIGGVPLSEVPDNTTALPSACRAVARALAELHGHSTSSEDDGLTSAPIAPVPWALHSGDLPPSMRASRASSACSSVLAASTEPRVRCALQLAASTWRPRTWIHGDLSLGNILVASQASSTGPETWKAMFVDFEGSGIGDPDWDLVTVVATVQRLGHTPLAGQVAADQLLTEYWRAGGPGKLSDALLTTRALHTAWQLAAMTFSANAPAASNESQRVPDLASAGVAELLEVVRAYAVSALHSNGLREDVDP